MKNLKKMLEEKIQEAKETGYEVDLNINKSCEKIAETLKEMGFKVEDGFPYREWECGCLETTYHFTKEDKEYKNEDDEDDEDEILTLYDNGDGAMTLEWI